MQTKEKLEQELADVLVKIDKAEKRLKSLRRPPTDASKGKTRISFITEKEQMAEAAEVSRELDNLRRREPEIRDKLQSHSQGPEKRQVIDLEDVTMNEKKVKKPKKQQKKGKGKAKGKA